MANITFQIIYKISLFIKNFRASSESGYTLIELLVVMAIAGILLGIVTINLVQVQHNTSLSTSEETLIADIRSQQMKAMQGTDNGGNFGIHFLGNNTYTLFKGTYTLGDPNNAIVSVDGPITYGHDGDEIIFTAVKGETSPSSVTVTNTAGGEHKVIQLNKYGAITQE